MSAMPYTITIEFDFPNGDPTQRPTVLTPTDRVDVIGTDFSSVTWKVAANISDMAGLAIENIFLFSDAAKRNSVDLGDVFVTAPSFNPADGSMTAEIKPSLTGSLRTYYYDLIFSENNFNLPAFDPTLKIQPRTSAGNTNQGEGGAGMG